MRDLKTLLVKQLAVLAFAAIVALAGTAYAEGLFPGLPGASFPLTGVETFPADTHLSSGVYPQTETISVNQIKGYARTRVALTLADPVTIDASSGEFYTLTLGAAPSDGVRSINTPTNTQVGKFMTIAITQDSTGSRTVEWPGVFQFGCALNPNTPATTNCATTPTLSSTGGRIDVFTFVFNGNHWLEVNRMQGLTTH